MINASITNIVVTDSKLFNRTGAVGRWAAGVERAFTRHAISEAPSGIESGRPNKSRANMAYPAGSMKLSISGEVQRVGPRHIQTTVSVNVPYALYVLRGTGVIFSKSARVPAGQPGAGQFQTGRGLYLPAQPFAKSLMRQRVRGQRANNFLARAFDRTAITHSSLRGYQMIG